MKLNLEYYKKEYDYKMISKEYEEVLEKVDKCKDGNFSNTLNYNSKIKNILALSEIRENILNWYNFKENCNILELNANYGEITGLLCNRAKKVVSIESSKRYANIVEKRHKDKDNLELIVGDLKHIVLNEKFDYAIIIGIAENLKETVEYAKKYLKDDGILLIAVNNKFGVKAWITSKEEAKVVNNSKTAISKNQIKEILGKMNYRYYFPLPDYKLPNIIYTENTLPDLSNIYRDLTYKDENVNFKEVDAYREIIKDNPEKFTDFANSFLIEASNKELCDNKIKFITFSNIRKDEYRIKTIIKQDKVYKTNVNEKSKKHIENIKENIEILNNAGMHTLDTYEDGKVVSIYTNEITLEDKLISIYKEKGKEELIRTIQEYKEFLKQKLETTSKNEKNVFEKYGINYDPEQLKELTFIKNGLWDLIFQNCFVINNEYYFYDQEWKEINVPVEYIIYRAITYSHEIKQYISDQEIFKELGIDKFVPIFLELDNKLQEKIRKPLMWNIHTKEELEKNKRYKLKQSIEEKNIEIKILKDEIEGLRTVNIEKSNELAMLKNSLSWKITKPLRKVRSLRKKG